MTEPEPGTDEGALPGLFVKVPRSVCCCSESAWKEIVGASAIVPFPQPSSLSLSEDEAVEDPVETLRRAGDDGSSEIPVLFVSSLIRCVKTWGDHSTVSSIDDVHVCFIIRSIVRVLLILATTGNDGVAAIPTTTSSPCNFQKFGSIYCNSLRILIVLIFWLFEILQDRTREVEARTSVYGGD